MKYKLTYNSSDGTAGDAFQADAPSEYEPQGMLSTYDNDNDLLVVCVSS